MRHQHRDVGGQPQVQRQRRIGRPEIDDHVVDVERRDRRQRPLGRLRGREAPNALPSPRDQPDAGDRRVDDQLVEAGRLAAQELAEPARRTRRAEQLVQRAARGIGVQRDDLLPRLRQVDGDVGGQQRPPGAAAPRGEARSAWREAARLADRRAPRTGSAARRPRAPRLAPSIARLDGSSASSSPPWSPSPRCRRPRLSPDHR